MSEKFSREQFAAKLDANGDPHLNAAADFAARLLNGPMGDKVERIMLFGSVATGEARPNSDVDLMVFGDASEDFSAVVGETALEVGGPADIDVMPLTYSVDDIRQPRSYVVYNTLKRGREIFARGLQLDLDCIDEGTMRNEEAHKLCSKAERYLTEAPMAVDRGSYEISNVAAYTAAELAARAHHLETQCALAIHAQRYGANFQPRIHPDGRSAHTLGWLAHAKIRCA